MAKKEVKTTNQAASERYSKRQLVCSERYCNQSDLLCALLDDGKLYSLSEVEEIMKRFMKGRVKVC